jgi:large subunit ribosomal protein L5
MKLKERFENEIAPKLKKELKLKNVHAVPEFNKIVVNAGLGNFYTSGTKDFSEFIDNFKSITGQKPVVTKTKKSISNFKIREDMPNGMMVTLRGERMYDFLEKLIHVVFPRIRDFRGFSPKAFDGRGNYSVGIREHVVFPEINPDDIVKVHGMQICITTTATNDEEGYKLLESVGFPFKKKAKSS